MSTIVCNKPCKYRKAVFCGKDFVMLNQFGMCNIWFDRNGQTRRVPDYDAEASPNTATKQQSPHPEKTEPKSPIKKEKVDANCCENAKRESEEKSEND